VFLTRRGDAMRLGGFLVDPTEIESALAKLPGVAEAQVVAVEIDGRNRCVAFVVRQRGRQPKAADLLAAVSGSLAAFKVPVRIWFLDELPVTRSANATKIQRGKLKEMALERLAKGKTGL
jgi:fatty-acyl-CoA synthase